jgi:hypothetical protein
VGPQRQWLGEKEKEKGERWAGTGGGLGRLGRKGSRAVFFFSFFKLHFQIIFHLKFNSNFFNLFSRIL